MKWMKGTPTKPGWYWFRNVPRDDQPRIVELRIYRDEIAIGNSTLRGFYLFETGEWAGPIKPPKEA